MPEKPLPLKIGPFTPEDEQGIIGFAQRMAREVYDFLLRALEPFLHTRVIIELGVITNVDVDQLLITVFTLEEATVYAIWSGKTPPNPDHLIGMGARVLWDSRTGKVYFDDVMVPDVT